MKKILGMIGLLMVSALFLTACGADKSSGSASKTIVVGSVGSDAEIWQHIAKTKEAKEAGLNIQVKTFTDGVQLNNATAEGQVDVNAFQSWTYFVSYVKDSKAKLSAFATTYLEPMGIYSDKIKDIKKVPKNAVVAIPNDAANEARALLLLQSANLVKLKPDFGAFGSVNDVVSNPKHLQFKEIDGSTGPRVLKDVDIALIGNTTALEGHLNVLKDSLFHEELSQDTKANVNILVAKSSRAKEKNIQKLADLYHNRDIQNWIKKQFNGTKVEVNKPVSYLK